MKTDSKTPTAEQLASRYATARANLLTALLLTAVNLILWAVRSNFYFPFCAGVSYYGSVYGVQLLLLGAQLTSQGIALAVVFLAAALAEAATLLICWIFSKKSPGFLAVALAVVALDTLALVGIGVWFTGSFWSVVLDLLFHGWILFALSFGLRAAVLQKRLPPATTEEAETATAPEAASAEPDSDDNSDP